MLEHKKGFQAMNFIFRAWISATLLFALAFAPTAYAQQKSFATPQEAMNALVTAIATNDSDAIKAVLGPDYAKLIPPVGEEKRSRFLAEWAKSHAVVNEGEDRAMIAVGESGWTLPIPIVKTSGAWQFDTAAGADEIRIRRIGRNELAVMQVMLAIYDAQIEYAEKDRDGDGVRSYATRFESSPGTNDGLYWPTSAGEEPSPLGPTVAAAMAAGGSKTEGYYGYRYKMLSGQGKHAPGGAYDYVANGKKLGGFAVLATPVKYGDSGVMSFMINHDGVLFEKDFGMSTDHKMKTMTLFDPDSNWRKVRPAE